MHYQGIIHRYKKYLPVTEATPIVSLCEGRTPLVEAMNIAKLTGVKGLKVLCKI